MTQVSQQQGGVVDDLFLRRFACHLNSFVSKSCVTFQGRLDEADPLSKRSLAIHEKVLGPDHPDLATVLDNRATLLKAQVRAVMVSIDLISSCAIARRGGVVETAGQSCHTFGGIPIDYCVC